VTSGIEIGRDQRTIYVKPLTEETWIKSEVNPRLQALRRGNDTTDQRSAEVVRRIRPLIEQYVACEVRRHAVSGNIQELSIAFVLGFILLVCAFGVDLAELPPLSLVIVGPLTLYFLYRSIRALKVVGRTERMISLNFPGVWKLPTLFGFACLSLAAAGAGRFAFDLGTNELGQRLMALVQIALLSIAIAAWIPGAAAIIRFIAHQVLKAIGEVLAEAIVPIRFELRASWTLLHVIYGLQLRGDPDYLGYIEELARDFQRHVPRIIKKTQTRTSRGTTYQVRSRVRRVREWPDIILGGRPEDLAQIRDEMVTDLGYIARGQWLAWKESTGPDRRVLLVRARRIALALLVGVVPACLWLSISDYLVQKGIPSVVVTAVATVWVGIAAVTATVLMVNNNPVFEDNPALRDAFLQRARDLASGATQSSEQAQTLETDNPDP
jgi:hypothetical protein